VIKLGYDAVELPELNVVAVDKLFCGFDRGLVIETIKLNCSNEMAIEANDINPVLGHLSPIPQPVPPIMRSRESQGVCSVPDSNLRILHQNQTGLLFEGLCGQPKKMADGARPVFDLQPPFGAFTKPCDGIADHISACSCGLVPNRVIIQAN
jgi:hypothetical protein